MRRLLPLLLLVLIPAPATALADGCPPSTCGTTSVAPPGSRVTLVRPTGQQGPAEAFDLVTGARSFVLPDGILAADGRTFVSYRVVKTGKKTRRTMLERYDARTGRLRSTSAIPGSWFVGAVSANAGRVALQRYMKTGTLIAFAGRAIGARRFLRGNWEIEALSPDGTRLFFVHWHRYGTYTLENLDLRTGGLAPTRLDEPKEKMTGQPEGAVASRDGHWLLTLYLKNNGKTFLHALNLRTGLAHCIDLPLIGDLVTVGSTALTLSPDERQLYLAAPYVGHVTTVDLGGLRVSHDVAFTPLHGMMIPNVGPSAAVTANGRMLAFSGGKRAWLYDTAYGVLRKRVRAVSNIRGIGFRPDGRRLMTLADAGARAFDAATGEPVR
jgi:hypothetical protein